MLAKYQATPEDFVSQPDQFPTDIPPAIQGIDRRTVIRNVGAAGVGVVGAATLAACGGSDKTSTTPAPAPAPASKPAAAGGSSDAIKVADIPVGGGKVFDATKVVVTQPKAGEFKAFSAVCTHKGCTVGSVADGKIKCPCHGSMYDMTTGKVVGGPAPAPLASKKVTVSGDSLTVA